MKHYVALFMILLGSGVAALGYTNVLEGGVSQTIMDAWDAPGDMTVGGATTNNALSIIWGGSLTNEHAFIGAQAGASNNTASVSGTGAEWISTGTMQIGAAGNTNNAVSVSSGGTISASNLVIHAGSRFDLSRAGTLVLEEGLDVSTNGFNWGANGTLSVGGVLTGLATTNEGAILTGEKTLVLNGGSLSTSTNLIVGYESSDNTLVITNGATVANANGYIGWGSNATDNAVLVSDVNSAWTNSGNLYVGVYGDSANLLTAGSGNSLTVSNHAWVLVGGLDTNLTNKGSGGITVASNATMVVGGNAEVLTEGLYIDDSGDFELDGTLRVAGDFNADQAGFNWNDGSTLTVNGNLTKTTDLDGTDQTLNIDGGSWNRGGDLRIDGAGNHLSILSGGGVTNGNGFVGTLAGASNNTVLVSGNESHWINNGALSIGHSASNTAHSVTVEAGGLVQADSLSIGIDDAFNLKSGGTLAMTGGFNVLAPEHEGLRWERNGTLSVGGAFTGLTNLAGGRILVLDGNAATWDLAHTNIWVGGDLLWGAMLVATNGATVKAANLRADGSGSTVKVAENSWLLVGDGATNLFIGGAMVASTNDAELVVGGNGSRIEIDQTLFVGVDAGVTGTVSVASEGTLSVGELIIATNSTVTLDGTLKIGSAFNLDQPGDFIWNDGGTLSMGGALTGLDALGGTNRTLEIAAGGTWNTTTDLLITGTGNTLSITNGGVVNHASGFIGVSSNDWGNTVQVGGNGSKWILSDDLFVNSSNTLALASNGVVTVGGNMFVSNATVSGSGTVELGGPTSLLSIYGTNSVLSPDVKFDGKGGTAAFTDGVLSVTGSLTNRFANFDRLSLTNSLLTGTGMVDGFPNVNMSGGWIVPNGELVVDGIFTPTQTTLRVTAGTDRLHTIGSLNLLGLTAEVVIDTTATNTILVADGGLTGDFAETHFIEHFLLYDFELMDDGTNVLVVSEAATDGTLGAVPAYAGIQGVRAGFNGMQNAAFVRTKQLRRHSVATDHAISHEVYLMLESAAPDGPKGPGDQNTVFGMHFWAEQFSGQGDYNAIGNSDGFTLDNNGTSFGFDRLFGDALVLGVNYTYARSAGHSDGGDRSDTETYWLGLYSEWFTKNEYYLEGLLALGWSDYEIARFDSGYQGLGSFKGSNMGGHIEGGKYFHYKNWAAAPYAGANYLGIKSDAYTETDPGGGPSVKVSGQSIASFESALGIKLRNRFDTTAGRFQTVGYAEWTYDFINDDIASTLSDGSVSVGTARITPGASVFNAGVGFSWICTEYLEVGLGYDGRFNENYEEHTGSIMLDVRF